MLRSAIAVVSSVAMLVAQMPSGFAQNAVSTPARPAASAPAQDATPSPAILDAFKAFPNGGDLLSKRIEDLVVKDPKLAVGLAKYVQTAPTVGKDSSEGLTREQKLAAFRGLAAALNRMRIYAADLPVYKAPPREPPPAPWVVPWGAVMGLVGIGIVTCLEFCDSDGDPVSP